MTLVPAPRAPVAAERLPPVWLGVGAVTDPRALARFGDLSGVPVPVGPVRAGTGGPGAAHAAVHAVGVGGVDHDDAGALGVEAAADLLRWAASRRLAVCLALRGDTTADLAAVLDRVRRTPDADAVVAVEVDLRDADDQRVLRSMSRVREASPRDRTLLARLAAAAPDLVGRARAAVAGGASAVVVSGQVPLGPGRWWSGPSTAARCRSGVRELVVAAGDQRWPGVPLVAAGGVHDAASARAVVREGARAVQLGTALWADPTVLWRVRDAVLDELAARDAAHEEPPAVRAGAGTRHTPATTRPDSRRPE